MTEQCFAKGTGEGYIAGQCIRDATMTNSLGQRVCAEHYELSMEVVKKLKIFAALAGLPHGLDEVYTQEQLDVMNAL